LATYLTIGPLATCPTAILERIDSDVVDVVSRAG